MRKLIPILALLLFFSLAFVNMLTAQVNHRFTTEIISGEEIVVSYMPGNDEGGTRNDYPPIWDDPPGGGSTMGIIVKFESNPRVNDVPLEPGDFIGGFYTDDFGELKCGGASPWPGNLGVVVSLRGDNPGTPEKDGFAYQEQIYFKFWSWERMKEYYVDIIDFDPASPTTDKWISLGLSEVINMQALVDFDFYISASANPLCVGNEVVLTANEFLGSNGNYTYNWSSDPPGFDFNVPDPPAVFPPQTTTYFLTVSDGNQASDHFLKVNVNNEPEVSVSEDGTICEDDIFSVSAEASSYSSILWTSSGDGYYTNSNGFTSNYYPGPGDKANGGAILSFTAQPISPCTMPATDFVTLTINKYPTVDAGPDMNACDGEPGGILVAANGVDFETVLWTTNGDGTFEDPTTISTLYHPGTMDYNMGDVKLDVCVYSTSPCNGSDCDEVKIEFSPGPVCNAPSQLSQCENLPIQLAGLAYNNDGLLWTTQGDGTFDNPAIINAKYYAGENDKLTGQTVVTLNAFAIEPCTVAATKDVNLIFYPLPSLSTFGANTETMCPDDDFLQLNADLYHYTSFSWSTTGDGNFTGANTLSPKYYPGSQDYQNEFLELELTAGPVTPCTLSQTFTLYTEIYSEPLVNILTESGIASCGELMLTMESFDVESVSWNTSGDGYFDNPTGLSTNYFPGPADLLSPQFVTISLEGFSPCPGLNSAQDAVEIFFQDNVNVSAGADANICETESFALTQAEASDYETIGWTTSGDGTFDDPAIVNPIYFPGANDITAGQVILSIAGSSILPCVLTDTDEIQLLISEVPEAEAGTEATICDTENHEVQNATAVNFDSFFWETSGDGSFDNNNSLSPVYFPGSGDIMSGSVILSLNVLGIEPCGFMNSDNQILTIQQSPEAFAGNDGTICDNESYQIIDADANHFSGVSWETSGDGLFDNSSIVNTEYFPGPSDINTGSVVLTLNVVGIDPCNSGETASQVLTIQKSPVADAGPSGLICEMEDYIISQAFANHYSSLNWETSGDGTFSNAGIINPVYSPGILDIFNGTATLTLYATGIDPCNLQDTDSHVLNIQLQPEVDAGSDAAICNTAVLMISDATVNNSSSANWETNGDGTFSDPATITPLYVPGPSDISSGNATLTLSATGIDPCNFMISDQLELTLQQSPEANAGPDVTICENSSHPIQGAFADQYDALLWLTSGDGTFSNQGVLNPTYFPGPGDILTGSVSLNLLATGLSPCYYPAIDEHQLFIQPLPVADAGDDLSSCGEATLNGSATNSSSTLWTTAGDGTFSDPGSVSAIYYPGPGDISNLSAEIQLTAFPLNTCTLQVTDDLLLNFDIPTIVDDLDSEIEAMTGDLLQLEFVVTNPGSGNFSWYKDGELQLQYTSGTLLILEVSPDDHGTYQCIFTNDCGEVSSTEAFVQVLDIFVQVINLEAGWQGISSFVEPYVTDVPLILQPIVNQVVILSNNEGFYWPEQSINTLGPWSNTTGYRLKMQDDATLTIEGVVRYPRESLTIMPGWTYLPVNSPCPLDVEDLFGSTPSITMIKDMAGTAVYLPGFGINNLQTIEPGNAYQIYNSSDTPVIIQLPECD